MASIGWLVNVKILPGINRIQLLSACPDLLSTRKAYFKHRMAVKGHILLEIGGVDSSTGAQCFIVLQTTRLTWRIAA
ncbi:hypothetical protein [Photorhabdus noenieputensis]|uniref:hypothetical protein n=1 Tax=Photorhabdus noenieputensis TaxID=1208607 RepID=UPI001BD45C93|nr:hypothetical protein [Photorhabdus noenieputensis]MCK3669210.1 hypothetical protein [Photorhabdus noenieputensis]